MRGYRDQEIIMYTVERFLFLIFKKFKKELSIVLIVSSQR